ncbi:hypothetical protein NL676_025862 [Syzygium grande]|nr:hypothetical protein NL676_025862 [Syzygium grande]
MVRRGGVDGGGNSVVRKIRAEGRPTPINTNHSCHGPVVGELEEVAGLADPADPTACVAKEPASPNRVSGQSACAHLSGGTCACVAGVADGGGFRRQLKRRDLACVATAAASRPY